MKRRKFINTTLAATALPLTYAAGQGPGNAIPADGKEIYELRTYEIRTGGSQGMLKTYLKEVYFPAVKRAGANHTMLFNEMGMSNPVNLWALISYPDATAYLKAQDLSGDATYQTESKDYHALPLDRKIYNRFTSSLLWAFDNMPKLETPMDGAGLFELRIYEGYSEDAVRRKIKMFNVGEIDIFRKTKLDPVFFGEMIIGPYRPCLVYMLNFKDMEARDANWRDFINHPEWKELSGKEEYANTVSNIRRIFLVPG